MRYSSKTVGRGRSRIEIAMILLLVTRDEIATTKKIMQRTFLSYTDLKEYLALLVEHHLLVYEERNQTYITTEKGKQLLRMCSKMDRLVPNTT